MPPRLLLPAHDDEPVGSLVVAGFVTAGRLAPRRLRMIALRAPLAATVRMVDGVHRDTAPGRGVALPPRPTGFADRNVLVIQIADLTDGGATFDADQTLLAGRQFEKRVLPLFRHELRGAAGAAHHLPALADSELDVVHHRAERNVLERQT